MKIADAEVKAIMDVCLSRRLPMAMVCLPGSTQLTVYASRHLYHYDSQEHPYGFVIREFGLGHQQSPWIITDDISTTELLTLPVTSYAEPEVSAYREGTPYDSYIAHSTEIIERLKSSGGKTVYSRLIALEVTTSPWEVAKEYFAAHPHTLRYIYYTPQTGVWLGASPELLIDYHIDTRAIKTMSLAGTRVWHSEDIAWDEKNVREHRFVTDYLMAALENYGLKPHISDSSPLRFGAIEHLCDIIEAEGEVDSVGWLDAVSPTPALCGMPCAEAYRQILEHEVYRRRCYGGWIAISSPERVLAYVNLRCAMAERLADGSWLYNIYAGGGLTADSVPDEEWAETERKSALLQDIIKNKV